MELFSAIISEMCELTINKLRIFFKVNWLYVLKLYFV